LCCPAAPPVLRPPPTPTRPTIHFPGSPVIGRHAPAAQTRTHGDPCCQVGVLVWPGDFRAVGLRGCLLLWLCSQLPGSCRRAVPGPAGAPAAWAPGKAPARTNELDVGKRRPMIGSEESACWLRGLLGRCRWLVPPGARGWRSGLTCTHPAPAFRWWAP
jgi:hypothetical protein